MTKTPQLTALLRYLRAHPEGITPLDAWRELGIYRLGARIFDLRREGYDIGMQLETSPYGARHARYRLVGWGNREANDIHAKLERALRRLADE